MLLPVPLDTFLLEATEVYSDSFISANIVFIIIIVLIHPLMQLDTH